MAQLAAVASPGTGAGGGWLALAGFIALLLVLDLFVFHRDAHEVSIREAGRLSAFYLAIEGGTNRTSGLAVQGVGAAATRVVGQSAVGGPRRRPGGKNPHATKATLPLARIVYSTPTRLRPLCLARYSPLSAAEISWRHSPPCCGVKVATPMASRLHTPYTGMPRACP